jgi:hypothetical protein
MATFALVTASLLTSCTAPVRSSALPAPSVSSGRVVQGGLRERTGAFLTLDDAASRVDVQTASLPGLLYRITTAAEAGLTPRVTDAAGRVRVTFRPTSADGPDDVTIVLNQAVRWDLRLRAGAGEQHLDLGHGRITRLDLGGAGLVTASLPRPYGTVPITLTDATGSVRITTPRDTAVRVSLRHGAGQISVPWTSAPGPLMASPGWPTAADRYAIEARSDVGTLALR